MVFSVIIPTYNRVEALARTLRSLGSQRFDASLYEVIVVDDGSTDLTAATVRGFQESFPAKLHYHYQPNQKQGAARNLGVQSAEGDFLIFLGDDITPAAGFLENHNRARQRHRLPTDVILGYTTWPDEYEVTRFLDYIGEQGWQFGFSLIEDPENVPFNFFYTSNVSISRRFFLDSGGFDEDFQDYGWEDIELSLRLNSQGMRLRFWPGARAFHHHPMGIATFIRRQHQVGASAWKFHLKHRELAAFLGTNRIPAYRTIDHLKMTLLSTLCRLTERRQWPDLSRFYPDLMSYYYNRGLIAGRDRERLSK
ncbi:MAG: glycosyltransferase [Acidobacteriota bacterium]|nr:MAG: glycosyltransferase [Acidobacteriota bacterium]